MEHDQPPPVKSHSRRTIVLVTITALALIVTVAVLMATGTFNWDHRSTPLRTEGSRPTEGSQPDVVVGGASSGGCVETYDATTIAHRQLALDGEVQRLDGDRITFKVLRWFRGGSGANVSLSGASALGGLTSSGPALDLRSGTRLLVAGDGGFAWSCGFTQPYNDETSDEWAKIFSK